MTRGFTHGFTLLEILLGVAIMAILLVVTTTSLSQYRDNQLLHSETFQVFSLLNEARSKTLASEGASEWSVRFNTDRAILFKGVTFASSSSYNKEIELHSRLHISPISINGGGLDVNFARLTGEATPTYGTTTISLVSDASKKKEVVISPSGIINQD